MGTIQGGIVVRAIHDAFYFAHFPEMFAGKHQAQAVLQAIDRNLRLAERECISMARGKGHAVSKTDFQAIKFVNYNLTDEEKKDHDNANRPVEYVAKSALKLVSSGYGLKVAFDAYSKCYQATLTVWLEANSNFGYGLSARGATPERALSLLLYKHFDVLKENWATLYKAPTSSFEG